MNRQKTCIIINAISLFLVSVTLTAAGQETPPQRRWSAMHRFKETTPLTIFANKKLLSWSFTRQNGGNVTFYDPNTMISLLVDWIEYSPGATHPESFYDGVTFAMINASPTGIGLPSLFQPNSNFREIVSKAVIDKLKQEEGATEVQNGSVKALTAAQLNRFVVVPDGLVFLINEYEVGPYSAGRFKIKLTFDELGPDFRRELFQKR
jgi:hypothetical protein